jgi:hypothetical protein
MDYYVRIVSILDKPEEKTHSWEEFHCGVEGSCHFRNWFFGAIAKEGLKWQLLTTQGWVHLAHHHPHADSH